MIVRAPDEVPMPAAPTCQFSLLVEAVDGDLGGPEAVEAFAAELRSELAGAAVTRIERMPAGDAPEGARSGEILAACEFVMTAVQTAAALPDIVAAIRRSAARLVRNRQRVRLTVAGVELDPVDATDGEVNTVVDTLLRLPASIRTGTRAALVVATSHYDDPRLAQLRSPGHDAEALGRVLGDPAIGGFEVDVLLDADERAIRRRTAAFFADRDRDDLLLLHFSCHGVKDARGRLHLAARDTDLSVLGATAVPAAFVSDLLSETQSRRVVLILDCCYSGAFARGGLVRAGSEVHIADEFGAGSGRVVLTASSATEYAFEGGELARSEASPSAFTSALVAGLESGDADLDADGEISIDELYDYTYRAVRESTPGQAPMKWSFGVEGSLVLARSVRPAALPSWIDEDLLSDRVVLRLEAVRALGKLATGDKPGLRAAAIATLARLRDRDDSVRVQRAAAAALAAASAPATPAVPSAAPSAPTTPATPGTPAVPPTRPAPPTLPMSAATPAPPAPAVPPAPAAPGTPAVPPAPARPAAPAAVPAAPPAPVERSSERRAAEPAAAVVLAPPPEPPPAAPGATPAAAPPAGPPADLAPAAGRLRATRTDGGPAQAPRAPGRLPLVAAGVAVLSVLAYLIGALIQTGDVSVWYDLVDDDWPRAQGIAWAGELIAASLLLITRQRRWAGALAGVLAWEWLYLGLIWLSDMTEYWQSPGVVYYLIGSVAGIAALVLSLLAMAERQQAPGPRWLRLAAPAAVAGLGVLATVTAARLLAGIVLSGERGTALTLLALCCAAVPAVALLIAPTTQAAHYAALGWLVGGLQYLVIEATALYGKYSGTELTLLGVFLVLATAAAGATALLTNRREPV